MRADSAEGIEEIVVTARKRAELIEDTPVAVTALSADNIREADITRLNDIRQFVPGLQIQFTPVGVSQASQFRIRGIGTTRAGTSFDPGVAVYVDGVYLPNSVSSLINLVDVQQIEVLRGPQGTLFGKNSVGGAISISTVKPTDQLEGSLLVRPGNFDLVDTRGMLNIPITDNLSSRFALATTSSGGYYRNTFRNENLGAVDSIGFLGSVRWQPTDAITVDLSGQWNRNRMRGTADECAVEAGASAGLAPAGFLDACRRSRPFRGTPNEHELSDQENWGAWGVIEWDLGDLGPFEDLFLKSITSWRGGETRFRGDIDGTELPVLKVAAIGPAEEDGMPSSGDSFMEEFQIGGVAWDGRLKFIAGGFGFWEETTLPQGTKVSLGPVFTGGRTLAESSNWDWAVFSQATGDITEWLSLTAGIRYTQEKKGTGFSGRTLFPVPEEPTRGEPAREVFDAWTPMASIALSMPEDWLDTSPLDHLMTYFTYSRGFRGGGFNAAPSAGGMTSLEPFDQEGVNSFEVGLKSIAFDSRLTANLAAFHYDYEDIQVQTTELAEDGESILQPIRNAADATGQGVELELQAMPLPGLLVTGSVAYIDTEFEDFESVSDLTGAPINRAGERFNNTPELQTNLAVQFSLPVELGELAPLHGYVTPRLQWYYQSDEQYAGPELATTRQRGYNVLNARLTYTFMDDRAQIALWGKNLTDEEYFSNAQPLASTFGFVVRTYNLPLTYGAELSYRFGSDS